MMLARILFFLITLCPWWLAAQSPKNYLFSQLNTHDGLASNTVYSVQQDSSGYIWILNGNTLQRYDGHRIISFQHEPGNPYSLPDGPLFALNRDTKNRLWITYSGFQIGYFDVKTFKFYRVKMNATRDELFKAYGQIVCARNGDVILVNAKRFAMTYDEKTQTFDKKFNRFQLPEGYNILNLMEDKYQGVYWIGTQLGLIKYNYSNGLLSYAEKNTENDPYIAKLGRYLDVLAFYMDSQHRAWMITWPEITGMRVYSYQPANEKLIEWGRLIGEKMNYAYWSITGFRELKDGSFWVHGENIFARLYPDKPEAEPITKNASGEYSINYDYVYHMEEDREQNVWLGTNTGLYRFNPPAQMIYNVKNKRAYDKKDYPQDVTDIIQTRSGDILVATWGEGVFSYDSAFHPTRIDHLYNAHMKMGEGMTWALHEHSNGDIWRAQQGGILFIWHKTTGKTEKVVFPGGENSTIRQISEDQQGNLWFGSQRGTLIKWDKNTNQYSIPFRLNSIVIRTMIDSHNQLWAATDGNGVFRLDIKAEKIIHHYLSSDTLGNGLRSSTVSDVIQYNDSLYVIAADGANILNTKTNRFRYITQKNGLPAAAISNMVKDKRGYIWMSTDAGIISYHPLKGSMSQYTANDGVNASYYNYAATCLLTDGRVAFGTAHDVLLFRPESLDISNMPLPKVQITGFQLMGKRVNVDSILKLKVIELNYDQASFKIEFATLNYQNMYNLDYMMSNIDKEWLNAGPNSEVSYNYLPPGEYHFKVSTISNLREAPVTELVFRIHPPFWKTWWFYSLLIIAAVSVLFIFDRQRLERLKKEQEIRTSIADNLHDEVNTVLQNISVLSEIARIKADTETAQAKEYIYEIQQKSRNMVVAMNDVLWSIDPSNDKMGKILDRVTEVAQALENKHSAKISIQSDPKVMDLSLSMHLRHEFILIYKLAVVTLVEELKAGQTTVQIDYYKSKLHLQIFSLAVTLPKVNNTITRNMNEIRTRVKALEGGAVEIQTDEKGTWIMVEMKA